MGKQSLAAFVMSLLASAAGGCSEPELPGDYWQVELTGSENSCTGGGASYTAEYELAEQNGLTHLLAPEFRGVGNLDEIVASLLTVERDLIADLDAQPGLESLIVQRVSGMFPTIPRHSP